MSRRREWLEWWDWELELSPYLLKRMDDRRFTEIDQRFTQIDCRFDAVEGSIAGLRQEMLGHFDEIYRRFERLEQEYRQRLQPSAPSDEQGGLDAQMGKLRRGIARLIDSYAEGFLDKHEFEPRVTRMRERLHHLEEQRQRLKEEAEGEEELRAILGRLETFAAKVKEGLHQADFQTRREIIRALVKRVEIDEQQIRVVFRISPISPAPPFDGTSPNLQHWGRRVLETDL